ASVPVPRPGPGTPADGGGFSPEPVPAGTGPVGTAAVVTHASADSSDPPPTVWRWSLHRARGRPAQSSHPDHHASATWWGLLDPSWVYAQREADQEVVDHLVRGGPGHLGLACALVGHAVQLHAYLVDGCPAEEGGGGYSLAQRRISPVTTSGASRC